MRRATKNWLIIITIFLVYNICGYLGYTYVNWTWSLPLSDKNFRMSIVVFESIFIGILLILVFFKFVDVAS